MGARKRNLLLKQQQQREHEEQQKIKKERKKQQCSFPTMQPFSNPNKNNMDNADNNNNNESKSTTPSTSQKKLSPQSQQRQQMRANSNANNIDGTIPHDNNTNQETTLSNNNNNTPLFERIQTEEIAELKSYNKILSIKNHQISTFEALLEDLESRLETETRQKLNLQTKLDLKKATFKKEKGRLEDDVHVWKNRVSVEKIKNKKLLEEVHKKDKEIHK